MFDCELRQSDRTPLPSWAPLRIEWSTNLYGQMSGWIRRGDTRLAPITLSDSVAYEIERAVGAHRDLFDALKEHGECQHVHDLPIETCLMMPGIEDNEDAACAVCRVLLKADWQRAVQHGE